MRRIHLLLWTITIIFIQCNREDHSMNTSVDWNQIAFSWKVITNYHQEKTQHLAGFTIRNNSQDTLRSDWQLYWNQSPRNIVEVKHPQLSIRKINGDFYEMKPADEFLLAPGEATTVEYVADAWLIKVSDGPIGVYVFQNDKTFPVSQFEIEPFENLQQFQRANLEATPPYTAERQFSENARLTFTQSESSQILPTPKTVDYGSGIFEVKPDHFITHLDVLTSEATLLATYIKEANGITLSHSSESNEGNIHLSLDESLEEEAYHLSIAPQQINITGGSTAGVFYGIQSLVNLIDPIVYRDNQPIQFPVMIVRDQPSYGYRGIHVDVSRHFFGKSTILKMIDMFSRYKINQLLLYFTEDEGWRIEIPGLPELTEVGSKRGHTLDDRSHLQPAYGSGPVVSGSNGTGYYSREDFIEILQYAYQRHIDVIPQVNFPGHARAAIKAMEARYQKYKDTDPEKAEQYRLIDPEDQSVYQSAQHYTDNIVCVCRESAFDFYNKVLDEIILMYEEAKVPLAIFHTGGDEVPRGAWEKSPICEEFLKDHSEIGAARNLQRYFSGRVSKMIAQKNAVLINTKEGGAVSQHLKMGGWEEVAMNIQPNGWTPNHDLANGDIIAYVWNNLWGNQDLGYKLANAGYPVVLCNVTNLYFDLAYNNDPREPGLYWGGFCNGRLAWEFIPEDLYKSTQRDALGNTFTPEEDFAQAIRLTSQGQKNILGIQAQLWAETIQDQDMLEYYYLPKLFGFAERAWNGDPEWSTIETTVERNAAADKAWSQLATVIGYKEIPKLGYIGEGFNYRIPTPGIQIMDDEVRMNTEYPGFEIRYTLDGSEPTESSSLYTGPVDIKGATVRAKAFDGQGRSGLVAFTNLKIVD